MKMNEPLKKLKAMTSNYGDQRIVADELDVSYQLISDILKGRRVISEDMALKLGYCRITKKIGKKKHYTYRPSITNIC